MGGRGEGCYFGAFLVFFGFSRFLGINREKLTLQVDEWCFKKRLPHYETSAKDNTVTLTTESCWCEERRLALAKLLQNRLCEGASWVGVLDSGLTDVLSRVGARIMLPTTTP